MADETMNNQQVPMPQDTPAPAQAPVEQPAPNDEGSDKKLTKEEETDLKIMVLLAERMIDDGGIKVIDQAIQESNDPAQVIGQFLMQLVSQINESLPQDMNISKRIYFCHGGWVEQISDYLQETYQIPRKIMDRVEIYIATAAQKMSQGQVQNAVQGGAPNAAVPTQPPMPGQPTAPQGA